MLQRLLPIKDDPALLDNRVKNISVKYSFTTVLSRQEIQPPTAGWKCDTSLFPKISKDVIKTYESNKRQGMIGKFRKAYRMFSSRRMKKIKGFQKWYIASYLLSQAYLKDFLLKLHELKLSCSLTMFPRKVFVNVLSESVVSVVMLSLYCYS